MSLNSLELKVSISTSAASCAVKLAGWHVAVAPLLFWAAVVGVAA